MGGKETPEVSLTRIGRHAPDQWNDFGFAPIVERHHEEAGSLSVCAVQVLNVQRGGVGSLLDVMAVIRRIGAAEIRERSFL